MIFYFSGNGNSKYVAEELAKQTGDRLENMSDYIRRGAAAGNGAAEMPIPDGLDRMTAFGVVFPIHAWGVPAPVQEFLKAAAPKLPEEAYKFAVCTCGDDAGKAMVKLKTIFHYDSAWSVTMPNTYILMFGLDGEDSCVKKIRRGRDRASEIARKIRSCEKGIYDVHEGGMPNLKSGLIHSGFVQHPVGPDKFTVNASLCTGCGLCASNCPVGNIDMKVPDNASGNAKLPSWGDRCINCLGCIHVCPTGASDCSGAAAKRGRYNIRYYLKRIGIAERKPLNR